MIPTQVTKGGSEGGRVTLEHGVVSFNPTEAQGDPYFPEMDTLNRPARSSRGRLSSSQIGRGKKGPVGRAETEKNEPFLLSVARDRTRPPLRIVRGEKEII